MSTVLDLTELVAKVDALMKAHKPEESFAVQLEVWRHRPGYGSGERTTVEVSLWDGKNHHRGRDATEAYAAMAHAFEVTAAGPPILIVLPEPTPEPVATEAASDEF